MAKVGAQRAAVLTGRSKSTIQRAMNAGKLSFEQDANGRRVIDVAELERAFGLLPQGAPKSAEPSFISAAPPPSDDVIAAAVERERMLMRIKMLEDQLENAEENIDDLRIQRDKWERQASQVVLTSQYTQKQAEELRAQLRERDERARLRRLQYEEKLSSALPKEEKRYLSAPSANASSAVSAQKDTIRDTMRPHPSKSREAENLEDHMKKLKAQNENTQGAAASVFRFWKKVMS